MGRLRSVLRAYALDDDDPAEVLGKLDREATHFGIGAMATVAYGVHASHGPVDRFHRARGRRRPAGLATTVKPSTQPVTLVNVRR